MALTLGYAIGDCHIVAGSAALRPVAGAAGVARQDADEHQAADDGDVLGGGVKRLDRIRGR